MVIDIEVTLRDVVAEPKVKYDIIMTCELLIVLLMMANIISSSTIISVTLYSIFVSLIS